MKTDKSIYYDIYRSLAGTRIEPLMLSLYLLTMTSRKQNVPILIQFNEQIEQSESIKDKHNNNLTLIKEQEGHTINTFLIAEKSWNV